MLTILFQYILVIFFQFCISIVLYVPLNKFIERIYTRNKPRSFKVDDILNQIKMTSKIMLLTGVALLGLTIIINIFYLPLIGFYLSSVFFLFLGFNSLPKGRKIMENCWVTPYQRDDFIVTLNDHKILISGERLGGTPEHVIYKEKLPKWLPPHECESVSEQDYEYMLKAIIKFLEGFRAQGMIQRPGEHVGPYVTKEEMLCDYARKGCTIEKLPDGTTKVNPSQRKNLLTRDKRDKR